MEEKVEMEMVDILNIPCKTCKFCGTRFTSQKCFKFAIKPSKVYYKGEECPFFEEHKLNEINDKEN